MINVRSENEVNQGLWKSGIKRGVHSMHAPEDGYYDDNDLKKNFWYPCRIRKVASFTAIVKCT
jgi:hypothetical protein